MGTVTEIYDYLRLLYARVGLPHCPNCGSPISQQTVEQMVDAILNLPDGSPAAAVGAADQRRARGSTRGSSTTCARPGFVRVRVNGEVREVDEEIQLDRYKMHTIEAVVDRSCRYAKPTAGWTMARLGRLGGDRAAPGRWRAGGQRRERRRRAQRSLFQREVRLRQVRHRACRRSSRGPSASTARTAPALPAPAWARSWNSTRSW
ncbi:MAG: hypothetical protein V9H69_06190 [Anaerolineae bacterium]